MHNAPNLTSRPFHFYTFSHACIKLVLPFFPEFVHPVWQPESRVHLANIYLLFFVNNFILSNWTFSYLDLEPLCLNCLFRLWDLLFISLLSRLLKLIFRLVAINLFIWYIMAGLTLILLIIFMIWPLYTDLLALSLLFLMTYRSHRYFRVIIFFILIIISYSLLFPIILFFFIKIKLNILRDPIRLSKWLFDYLLTTQHQIYLFCI